MATASRACAVGLLAATIAAPACAQSPNLAGKTVRMVIGSGVAGTYDLLGRLVARHIGNHLPGNPAVVPQNMPGAGGLAAANYIYNVAPKDGTVIGIFNKGVPGTAIAGVPEARFDAVKMTWLGTPITETSVCFAANEPRVRVKSVKDLFEHELVVGSPGVGTVSTAYPKALAVLLGLKFKLVGGYQGSVPVYLAMERGEVDGFCEGIDGVIAKRPDWIPKKQIVLLFQGGAAPNPDLKEIPFIVDFARTADDRLAIEYLYIAEGIGRPFAAPPDLAPDVRKMLQDAFNHTMKDAEFIADAKRQGFEPKPEDGDYLAALIGKMVATPKPIKDKIVELTK
jgi:tripartite-type tricarboxylate transporter receptor subunit TctC